MVLLSAERSGSAISLCAGPTVPPYVGSTLSPNSARMVNILSVFWRASSTYFPPLSLTTREAPRSLTVASGYDLLQGLLALSLLTVAQWALQVVLDLLGLRRILSD